MEGAILDALITKGRSFLQDHLNRVAEAIQSISEAREELPAWFTVEIASRATDWLHELDQNLEAGDNPVVAQRIIGSKRPRGLADLRRAL